MHQRAISAENVPITPSEGVVFSGISLLLPKEYGTLTLATDIRRSILNEFTSWCTRFYNRLKISSMQILLHIWLLSKGADVQRDL